MPKLYGLRKRPCKWIRALLALTVCWGSAMVPAKASPLQKASLSQKATPLQKAAPLQKASPLQKATPVQLLILGDSLTAGFGLPVADGFQARLAAALNAKGANVALVDGAVSGDTSADAAARLDWVLAGGPVNAALVELGGNDGLRGLDPEAMKSSLSHILDVLAADHIPVLLSGMVAPPSLGADYEKRFEAVFAQLGQRKGILYDPFFLQGVAGNPALTQADGIHPNAAGVNIEVKRLLPLVLRLISQAGGKA